MIAVDTVARPPRDGAQRSARSAVHLTEEDPRAAVKARDRGPRRRRRASTPSATRSALDLAIRLARKCGTRQRRRRLRRARARSTWASLWIKALTHAHRPRQRDRATSTRCSSCWPPASSIPRRSSPHHMTLDEAPEAYAAYDRREALKIVLTP